MLSLLAALPFLTEEGESDKNSLIVPSPGLMIWTIVTFLIVLYILKRFAFGRIAELLEERRRIVRDNLEGAERARTEAQALLADYKQQLARSRHEATEILERARRSAEADRARMAQELAEERERGVAAAQAAIQAETRQSLDRIKSEIADLTLAATERALGRALDEREQRRLIDDALADVDFSALGETGRNRR